MRCSKTAHFWGVVKHTFEVQFWYYSQWLLIEPEYVLSSEALLLVGWTAYTARWNDCSTQSSAWWGWSAPRVSWDKLWMFCCFCFDLVLPYFDVFVFCVCIFVFKCDFCVLWDFCVCYSLCFWKLYNPQNPQNWVVAILN